MSEWPSATVLNKQQEQFSSLPFFNNPNHNQSINIRNKTEQIYMKRVHRDRKKQQCIDWDYKANGLVPSKCTSGEFIFAL